MSSLLEQIGPDGPSQSHTLTEPGPLLVGRGRGCAIRLDDGRISRHHCALNYRSGKWHIEDLGSTNGTLVNDQKIHRATLADGDVIAVGRLLLRFRHDVAAPAAGPAAAAGPSPAALGKSDQADPGRTREMPALAGKPAAGPATRPLAGRYELGEILHQGSTGTFLRAHDIKRDRTVCIKILAESITQEAAELKRFVRGVRTAAKLHHPNIVGLYHAGQSARGWWLAMEYVDGPSLRQVVAKYGIGKMLPPAKVLSIARDITAALEVAFERQVLHRNIRPENILLTKSGRAKLGDFALVRGVVLTTLQRITGSSELVGDLAYMSPERTDPDGRVDCRADLYSLGACLYTLLAGRPPLSARSTVQLIDKIRDEAPVPPSKINLSVPGPLEAVVMKCLAKSPTDRYQTPMELREELSRVARFQGMWT